MLCCVLSCFPLWARTVSTSSLFHSMWLSYWWICQAPFDLALLPSSAASFFTSHADAVFCTQSLKKRHPPPLASSLSWCSAICNVTVCTFLHLRTGPHAPPTSPFNSLDLPLSCFPHCMTTAVFPHYCTWEHSFTQSLMHSSHSLIWWRNEEISEYCLAFDIVYNFIRGNHKVCLLCWEFACVTKKELPVSLIIILGSYVWLLSILFSKINILFIW